MAPMSQRARWPKKLLVAAVLLLVATATISLSCDDLFGPEPPAKVGSISWSTDLPGIIVTLSPTSSAVANETYTAELYERGYLCATTTVSWTSGELNSGQVALASFPLTSPEHQEYRYRSSEALADIFSVEVHS